MKVLVVLIVLQTICSPVFTISGVIWSKSQQEFVSIFSIPNYSLLQHERIVNDRKQETHNFLGQSIRFSYYQETNIFNIHNNTRPTGLIPDIWNILSEALNFTLEPTFTEDRGIGMPTSNGSFTGLLNAIECNRTDVIGKMEMFPTRLDAVRYTVPLWKTRHRLYIRQEVQYDTTWLVKLFTWKVWCAILVMYLLLTGCTFAAQMTARRSSNSITRPHLSDHFFYNFGMFCNQSYSPNYLYGRSRLMAFLIGLFTSVLRMAFSALLISCMMETIFILPFKNMNSLLDESRFKIVALAGSLPDIAFQRGKRYQRPVAMKRVVIVPTAEEMYRRGCSLTEKLAIFEGEDVIKGRGKLSCILKSIDESHFETWIASAMSPTFQFKRSFDIGILKLHEFGLIPVLQERWLKAKNNEDKYQKQLKPIVGSQVFLIQVAFFIGTLTAILICVIERLIFYFNTCNRNTVRCHDFSTKPN